MEVGAQKEQAGEQLHHSFSRLLELAAVDDLAGFKHAIEEEGLDVNQSSLWYGRKIGSKKMGFEERTPLMIASMFGSTDVLGYILQTGLADVNQACGSDGATALHCAVVGGSMNSMEIVRLLINSFADINSADSSGNRPCDVIAPCASSSMKSRRKALEAILKGESPTDEEEESVISDPELGLEQVVESKKSESVGSPSSRASSSSDGNNGMEKKEYPVDPSLPDIKNGIYGTDEFRMYMFKVKPCSRAYSHDWTECPFVHPGENARRRDPRKYHYSCVPCPDFRKGSCSKGDACDYAHGIFECWLHPAQYRTRLCKDEINCSRRVCFFAHKVEELRPLYPSTGSAMPSPRSMSSIAPQYDLSPLALGSPSAMMSNNNSTPPMTPTSSSSPMAGNMWQNQLNMVTPPALQLSGSRLKTALHARDVGLQAELLGFENQRRRQQLLEELAALSSPSSWQNGSFSSNGGDLGALGGLKPSNLEELYGSSLDPTLLPQSPTGTQIRQSMGMGQSFRANYSPTRGGSPTSFGLDPSGMSNQRLAAYAQRSHSFIDRGGVAPNRMSGFSAAPSSPTMMAASSPRHHQLSDWGSIDGKLDWGVQGDELNKLRKSASFGFRGNGSNIINDPEGSWVQSDTPPMGRSVDHGIDEELKLQQLRQYRLNSGSSGSEMLPSWIEQLSMEQEQMVA